jgi:GNAT superfamily N-acetyltransferase
LNEYFPDEEMKKKEQLEALLRHNPHYKKIEARHYILLYGEYPQFIFVDYVLVDQKARGQGIGQQLLDELKEKEKAIVLEVEPVVEHDPDTVKRERFYLNNDFQKADQILYYRDVGETAPELHEMEVYYWSPAGRIEMDTLRDYMLTVYDDIHHYQYERYFERQTPDPEDLVQVRTEEEPQAGDNRH